LLIEANPIAGLFQGAFVAVENGFVIISESFLGIVSWDRFLA